MSSDTGAGPASDLATVRLLLDKKGTEMYGGEAVTQAQHALQCGALAEAAGASPALITAAFLHDIGHLLDEDFEVAVAEGCDLVHEEAGARWLASIGLPDSVCQPVRLHVPAKRYLCATDSEYHDGLSQSSKDTLVLQGGAFAPSDADEFIGQPHAEDAVQLRRWDDQAKDPLATTPDLDHFMEIAAAVLASSTSEAA